MNFKAFPKADLKTGITWVEIRDEQNRVIDRRVTNFEGRPILDTHTPAFSYSALRWAAGERPARQTMEAPWLN
jgi:hypothetical protein